jgi:Tfp pilus assembly protein PilN
VSSDLQKQVARNATLTAEYNKVKKYQEEKDRFELEKELLNEKIQKISELKDRREGPVKIMEDVHNVLPESVWLTSISQSYDKGLTLATRTDGKAYTPGKNLAEPNLIRVEGKAKTPDAVTAFANKILSLGDRYSNTELNNYELATGKDSGNREINFTLFFKILKGPSKSQSEGS